MNFFEEAALRLKQQLKVSEDKQVAEAMGFSSRAWAGRKKRNSFPEKELWALAAQRPELKLDVGYVLNGARGSNATSDKSLIEIIDRFLTVYNFNAEQADEALSLPPGTINKALSFDLPIGSEPESRPPCAAALLDNYEHLSEEDKRALERTAFGLMKRNLKDEAT
jgi:hypothetical protein